MLFDYFEHQSLPKTPVLSVWLLTFNHRNYFQNSIESILSQQTTFDYEIVIGDDYSDDGTREIALKYYETNESKVRLVLSKENYWQQFGPILSRELYKSCRGKYIATCEGDDYWTDPFKIQKQVEYLENNTDISLVSHDYSVIKNRVTCTGNLSHYFNKVSRIDVDIENILDPFMIKSCAVMFRKDLLPECIIDNLTGDIVLFSYLLKKNKGVVLKDNMATYRIHETGIYSLKPEITKCCLDYIDLKVLENNNLKVKNISNKIQFLQEKIKDLINIDIYNSSNEEINNLLSFLEYGYIFKYSEFSYNLTKALLLHESKKIIILKCFDFKILLLNINLFFQRPILKNWFCLVNLIIVLIINFKLFIHGRDAQN